MYRSSNTHNRSLPDIPTLEAVGDTNSELYATVGDKVLDKPQGRSREFSICWFFLYVDSSYL